MVRSTASGGPLVLNGLHIVYTSIGPLVWCGYILTWSSSIECGLHSVWSVSNGPLVSCGLYDLHNQMVLIYHVVCTTYDLHHQMVL